MLTIPEPSDYEHLTRSLAEQWPAYAAYAVSFAVIAVGVTDVCVQGILLERLVRAFGDSRVLALGLGLPVNLNTPEGLAEAILARSGSGTR